MLFLRPPLGCSLHRRVCCCYILRSSRFHFSDFRPISRLCFTAATRRRPTVAAFTGQTTCRCPRANVGKSDYHCSISTIQQQLNPYHRVQNYLLTLHQYNCCDKMKVSNIGYYIQILTCSYRSTWPLPHDFYWQPWISTPAVLAARRIRTFGDQGRSQALLPSDLTPPVHLPARSWSNLCGPWSLPASHFQIIGTASKVSYCKIGRITSKCTTFLGSGWKSSRYHVLRMSAVWPLKNGKHFCIKMSYPSLALINPRKYQTRHIHFRFSLLGWP